MKLHEGHSFTVVKRVNGGHWMSYESTTSHEDAEKAMEYGLQLHHLRCPKDDVEFRITQNY